MSGTRNPGKHETCICGWGHGSACKSTFRDHDKKDSIYHKHCVFKCVPESYVIEHDDGSFTGDLRKVLQQALTR